MVREGVPYRQTLPIGGSRMGEALKAWALKQTAKAPVAPALSAWATFAQAKGVKWTGNGYYPPTSQPAPGYSSTTTTNSAFVIQDPYQ